MFTHLSVFIIYLSALVILKVPTIVSHLNGKHDERHKDHDDHQELRGPDLRGDVSEAHRGEGDHAEVERVEQGQVVARSLQVLDAADAEGRKEGNKKMEN